MIMQISRIAQKSQMTKEEAEVKILSIRQQLASMGNNDSEFDMIQRILDSLHRGDVAPAEALERANRVLASKQDCF